MIVAHEVHAPAAPEAVWAVLVDGPRWGEWNPDIAWMWVDEGLMPGAYLTVKPRRGRQTAYVIEEAVFARRFAIRLQFGPAARMHITWTLEPDAGGTRVVCAIATSGFAANWLVGKRSQRLAGMLPATLEQLAARA